MRASRPHRQYAHQAKSFSGAGRCVENDVWLYFDCKRPTNPILASLVSLVAGVFRSQNFSPSQVMVRSERWWRRLLADQQRSGMTVRECCQVAGVHVSSFYRWQKLLAAAKSPSVAAPQRKSVLTPVDEDDAGPSSGFVPVKIRQNRLRAVAAERSAVKDFVVGCGGLRVELPNGVVIHVSAEIDGQRLGDIVIAAGQIPRSDSSSRICHAVQAEEESC